MKAVERCLERSMGLVIYTKKYVQLLKCERDSAHRRKLVKRYFQLNNVFFCFWNSTSWKKKVSARRWSFQTKFNVAKGLVAKTIYRLFATFERTGSGADDLIRHVGSRTVVVTSKNVTTFFAFSPQHPRKSVRRIAAEIGLKLSSTIIILWICLHIFPYRRQCHQVILASAMHQMHTA